MKFSEVVKNACTRSGEAVPNTDPETGIAFGVINGTDEILNYDAVMEIQAVGEDLTLRAHEKDFRDFLDKAMQELRNSIPDEFSIDIRRLDNNVETFIDSCVSDLEWDGENCTYRYTEGGYDILLCGDGDVFIQKSPYYALRGECSPCAPCAGHLKTPGDMKTYVLGPDWYARDPGFKIYKVDNDEEVVCDFSDIS